MALHLIGLGLDNEQGLTLSALDAIKNCDTVYVEDYTNPVNIDRARFEVLTGKQLERAPREFVEDSQKLIAAAKQKDIALLVSGDPLSATTHYELFLEGKRQKVEVIVHHNASIFSAVAATGLSIYKFGATPSIPNPEQNYKPESFYEIFENNRKHGHHTLFLIDPNEKDGKLLSLPAALDWLLEIDAKRAKLLSKESILIACSNIGRKGQKIICGTQHEIRKHTFAHPCCIVVPGDLNFKEEEALAHLHA